MAKRKVTIELVEHVEWFRERASKRIEIRGGIRGSKHSTSAKMIVTGHAGVVGMSWEAEVVAGNYTAKRRGIGSDVEARETAERLARALLTLAREDAGRDS